MKKILTTKDLSRIGGEKDEIKRFKKIFPDGMEITGENLSRLEEIGIRISWIMARCVQGTHWDSLSEKIADICSSTVTDAERSRQLWEEYALALRQHYDPYLPENEWEGFETL